MAEVIYGIDHGFGRMKTATSNFVAGVKEYDSELPYTDGVLKYDGKWYAIGGDRLPYTPDKTINDNYYILTLASLAEEMKARGVHTAQVALAAGLPLTRFGNEKEAFKKYLSVKKEIPFEYEGEKYHVKLTSVEIFPQGYAAYCWHMLSQKKKAAEEVALVVDLGSGTMDISLMQKNRPQMEHSYSLTIGMHNCYQLINERLRQKFHGKEVMESVIDAVILGREVRLSKDYRTCIEDSCREFAAGIWKKLIDYGFNLDTIPVYWMGGGATLMREYGNLDADMNDFICVPEANALGYETLLKLKRASARKKEKAEKEGLVDGNSKKN